MLEDLKYCRGFGRLPRSTLKVDCTDIQSPVKGREARPQGLFAIAPAVSRSEKEEVHHWARSQIAEDAPGLRISNLEKPQKEEAQLEKA